MRCVIIRSQKIISVLSTEKSTMMNYDTLSSFCFVKTIYLNSNSR